MVKRIAILFLSALSLSAVCVSALACGAPEPERSAARLADYRPVLLEGSAGGLTATVMSGVRERDYALDGTCGDKTDYTVISLSGAEGDVLSVTLTAGDTVLTAELSAHPFGDEMSAEIPVRLSDGLTEAALDVGGTVVELTFEPPAADAGYALTLAKETAEDSRGEIVLRLTRNFVTGSGRYWYVSFTRADGSESVLINADSGEVASVRRSA